MSFWDPLAWEIIPRINIGPLSVSPHGLGIALGYLVGAQVMVRRARKRGGPPEDHIWNTAFWALLGALIGARVGYVIGRLPEVTDGGDDLLAIFRVWEGGISLLGGITGAVLVAYPYMRRKRMGFWRTMDLASVGLATGIIIGRVGDLIIGDHIGKTTDFPLGWRCLGEVGGPPPTDAAVYEAALEAGNPPALGCFDVVLHQTALYDLVWTALLLGLLWGLGRTARNTGFMILVFTVWYGFMRLVTDFLRVDKTYFGLTGSQITALLAMIAALYLLARYRGAPPKYAAPPPEPAAAAPSEAEATTESDQKRQEEDVSASRDDAP